ncbi:hypothetical protein UFOVP43_26 [uncultured Caudovirales phage]|uniref:Uncharacterized protein n=1 Tax=uncultured Caudovirales phage TaxID=2100421 RepID=A0A6J5KQ89_9CAUD|nr:hypothetical protein UFOVP43_26 [uncultured Caudovirales phage]
MSHNMNQTDWNKRQSALDKKADNARELKLDYEPNIIEMAREAGVTYSQVDGSYTKLKAFAALVRADEREACAAKAEQVGQHQNHIGIAAAIRAMKESI